MTFGSLLFSLLLLVAATPVVVIVHEAGHVLGGAIGGYYVAAAGVGGGRRFLTLPLGRRFNLFVGLPLFAGGATVAFPTRAPMRRRDAFVYHYGGIAAQLIAQLVAHLIYWQLPESRPYLLPGLSFNAVVLMLNLAPLQLRIGGARVATDGARVLAALGSAPIAAQAGLGADGFDPVAARLGTDVGRFVLETSRALRRDDERARAFLDGPEPPPGTPPLYAALFALARAAQAPHPDPSTTRMNGWEHDAPSDDHTRAS